MKAERPRSDARGNAGCPATYFPKCNQPSIASRTAAEALRYLEEKLTAHPLCNEKIVADIMRGVFSSAGDIGGDEADVSEWCAVCRLALLPNYTNQPTPGTVRRNESDV